MVVRAMHAPSREPSSMPSLSSFQTTLRVVPWLSSPRAMALMTIVDACPPVLPPAATTMGKNSASMKSSLSNCSNWSMTKPEAMAKKARPSNQGNLLLKCVVRVVFK